jgi:cytoskeletal protein CcmA (bactofilin family)
VISAGSSFSGEIASSGTITISGNIDGNVNADVVIISSGGRIVGFIESRELHIHGMANASIKSQNVFVYKTGTCDGDISYTTLYTEEGGLVRGTCKYKSDLKVGENTGEDIFKMNSSKM